MVTFPTKLLQANIITIKISRQKCTKITEGKRFFYQQVLAYYSNSYKISCTNQNKDINIVFYKRTRQFIR